jgi:uncharacterized protein YkwD
VPKGIATVAAVLLAAAALVAPAAAKTGLQPTAPLAGSSAGRGGTTSLRKLESEVLVAINAVRRTHRVAPLRASTPLATAARSHSQAMGTKGFFAHESADGSSFDKRVHRWYGSGGYGFWSVGENLLWSSPSVDAAGAVKMWMNSPGHRKNLLSPKWREIGLAALRFDDAPGDFGGYDVTIVTADFGVRR